MVITVKRKNNAKKNKRRNYISDVNYDKMVSLITGTDTYLPKKLRVYSSSPVQLEPLLKSYISGISATEIENKYVRLVFNSKDARDKAHSEIGEIINGGKIIGYDSNNPLIALLSNGETVRLTKSVNAPSGTSGTSNTYVSPVDNSGNNNSENISNKNLYIAIGVAVVLLVGYVIYKRKFKK